MRFSLRTILIAVAIFAAVLAWLVHSLSTINVDFASNGNDVTFADAEFAAAARDLHFTMEIDSVLVSIDGVDRNAAPDPNVVRFNIRIMGVVGRSVPNFQLKWPFNQSEFVELIETELEHRLGEASDPEYTFRTLPMPR